VHYLLNVHGDRFTKYQVRLAHAEPPDQAWAQTLSHVKLSELDKELHQYARYGNYSAVAVPLPEVTVNPTERLLTDADVHAWSAVYATQHGLTRETEAARRKRVQEDLQEALRHDPAHVLALRVQAELVPERVTPEMARAATRAHETDANAWLLLAQRSSPESRKELLLKAVSVNDGHPPALEALAWEYLNEGSAEKALPLAKNATGIAPWNGRYAMTYAAALFAMGDCAGAIRWQTIGGKMLMHGLKPNPKLQEVLAEYQKACPPGSNEL
jgi:tetratricopeptide (TPR) repeat protein